MKLKRQVRLVRNVNHIKEERLIIWLDYDECPPLGSQLELKIIPNKIWVLEAVFAVRGADSIDSAWEVNK